MLSIGPSILSGIFFLSWIAFWIFIIYAVMTLLHRLSDISNSLQNIDAKLPSPKRGDSLPPDEQA